MGKTKWAAEIALAVAQELIDTAEGFCDRIEIAGSLRRCREEVGDIEILYVPAVIPDESDLFAPPTPVDVGGVLLGLGFVRQRPNKLGRFTWGERIKLATHIESGIPVDLFEAEEASWYNYLVCRTGPRELNEEIATRAKRMGWKWEPYSSGFVNLETGERFVVGHERHVFEFVGLPYRKPWERGM